MARGFSKAIITGNLTRDPEVRTTPNGATVCTFAVAVNRSYRDSSGNQQEAVSFIDCAAWGRGGEIIKQYAKKGTGILVSGRLDQRTWEDKTGQKRSRVEIVVEDFNFLGGMDRTGSQGYAGGANYEGGGEYSAADAEAAGAVGGAGAADGAGVAGGEIPEDIPDEPIDLSEIPF